MTIYNISHSHTRYHHKYHVFNGQLAFCLTPAVDKMASSPLQPLHVDLTTKNEFRLLEKPQALFLICWVSSDENPLRILRVELTEKVFVSQ